MTGELSGVDLARQALNAAREAAKKNGATQTMKPKQRTTTVVRHEDRVPLRLGRAIGMMMTECGMATPAAGVSVFTGFDTVLAAIVPKLVGRVKAVAFDAATGRLDVVPDLPAAATRLRCAPKLIAAANEKVPGANVRALHALAEHGWPWSSCSPRSAALPQEDCSGWQGKAPPAGCSPASPSPAWRPRSSTA
ncbi:DUF721 domain-containing protein [Streptomyces sp. NRRL F-5702]|uniref:DUF721 domain-containing protein n=1 Tax=Streptomyces sp. NRRL F-5702 TaxID=1463870 RepID=UPI000AD561EB|nr:DUF721 domain-containing protein [Streptomyces sp. NRRL F-5702]